MMGVLIATSNNIVRKRYEEGLGRIVE